MSEVVQFRRDTRSNLAGYVGPQGEVLVETDDARLLVQDGKTPGGVAAALASELVIETTARTAGDTAEANARQAGDAANAASVAALQTALAAASDSITAALAAITAGLDAKASASDLAANTQLANALYPHERPGDGFGYFTPSIGPTITRAGDFPPIAQTTIQIGAEGAAATIPGVGYLLSREFYPVEPARTYAARVAFSVTQPGLGLGVLFGVFQYDASKALIGVLPVILASFTAVFPASGRQGGQALLSRANPVPSGQFGVDPATRYVRLVVQNIDPFQMVAVEVMRWVDVTDSTLFAPSVAALQNQITTLQSRFDALTANFYVAASVKVTDQDYAALAADGAVEMMAGMTASRTVTLPPLSSMPPLRPFMVTDTGGSVSDTIAINVVPAGSDLFNGVTAANGGGTIIQAKYGMVAPRRGDTSWLL